MIPSAWGDLTESLPALVSLAAAGDASAAYLAGSRYYDEENTAEAVRLLRIAAGSNHGEAMNLLGVCLRPTEEEEAVRWFARAARLGVADAQFNLGEAHRRGWGREADAAEAVWWYRQAAAAGQADAMLKLAEALMEGDGAEADATEAVRWYRAAAEGGGGGGGGDAEAMFVLGACYRDGVGVPRADPDLALFWFHKAAHLGLAPAQYVYGATVARRSKHADRLTGIRHLRRAALAGHAAAARVLDELTAGGVDPRARRRRGDAKGGRAVQKEAAPPPRLLREAEEDGDAHSLYRLSAWYSRAAGRGGEAAAPLREAARLGHARAQLALAGQLFRGGDRAGAVRLYRLAAEGGNADAQYNLGVCLFKGHGVRERRPEEALEWLFRAARSEQLDAQYFVALCLRRGEAGLAGDERAAARWLRRAAEQGHEAAGKAWARTLKKRSAVV